MVLLGGSMIETAVRTNISPTGLWVSCVVIVVSLGAWIGAVMLAARTPHAKHRNLPRMQSPVLGGVHEAEGGRSVAPHRDAPVVVPQLPGQRQPDRDQLDWRQLERLTVGADDERVRERTG
jgi:hypothetical protein